MTTVSIVERDQHEPEKLSNPHKLASSVGVASDVSNHDVSDVLMTSEPHERDSSVGVTDDVSHHDVSYVLMTSEPHERSSSVGVDGGSSHHDTCDVLMTSDQHERASSMGVGGNVSKHDASDVLMTSDPHGSAVSVCVDSDASHHDGSDILMTSDRMTLPGCKKLVCESPGQPFLPDDLPPHQPTSTPHTERAEDSMYPSCSEDHTMNIEPAHPPGTIQPVDNTKPPDKDNSDWSSEKSGDSDQYRQQRRPPTPTGADLWSPRDDEEQVNWRSYDEDEYWFQPGSPTWCARYPPYLCRSTYRTDNPGYYGYYDFMDAENVAELEGVPAYDIPYSLLLTNALDKETLEKSRKRQYQIDIMKIADGPGLYPGVGTWQQPSRPIREVLEQLTNKDKTNVTPCKRQPKRNKSDLSPEQFFKRDTDKYEY